MKNQIIKLLPLAEEAIKAEPGFVKQKDGIDTISKEYKGYVSSFGAAVIQSGLLPALYFNHGSEGSAKDRKMLMNVIYRVVADKIDADINEKDNKLLDYAKTHSDIKALQKGILNAATAVKLVIRTYKLV